MLRPTLSLSLLTCLSFAQDKGSAALPKVAKLYDVGDLLARTRSTDVGTDAETDNGIRPPAFGVEPLRRQETPRGIAAYVRLLRAFVKPALGRGDAITGVGTRWIAAAGTADQLEWIGWFLQAARTADAAAIHVQFTCYRTDEVSFQRDIAPSLPPALGTADGPHAYTTVLEGGEKTTAFLDALTRHRELDTLMAPGLAIEPLTIGEISTHNQTAYVRDFDIRRENGQIVCDPIVDVLEDGMTLDACVARLPGDRLGVSLGIAVAELQRPIPTAERAIPGAAQKVTVQLPNLRSTQLEGAFELASGQHVVLSPLPQGGMRHLFVVRVIDGGRERR